MFGLLVRGLVKQALSPEWEAEASADGPSSSTHTLSGDSPESTAMKAAAFSVAPALSVFLVQLSLSFSVTVNSFFQAHL